MAARVGSFKTLLATATVALALASNLAAQSSTIAGVVRDSAAHAISDAEIIVYPGGRRTRTDSVGGFVVAGLADGKYSVASRRIGFMPAQVDVVLPAGQRVDVSIVFTRVFVGLDTVVVRANTNCSRITIDGFSCRRASGRGIYLDPVAIAAKGGEDLGDLFEGVEGFRAVLRPNPFKARPERVGQSTRGLRCMVFLVDGERYNQFTNPLPAHPTDVAAMEFYHSPQETPRELLQYAWTTPDKRGNATPCSLVVYWTWVAVRRGR